MPDNDKPLHSCESAAALCGSPDIHRILSNVSLFLELLLGSLL
jgi:hypothetical protein